MVTTRLGCPFGIFEVGMGREKHIKLVQWEKEKWGLKLDVTKFSDEKRRG